MKNMKINDLINEYLNNSVAALEELTRRILFGELNESDVLKLYFTKGISAGIQQAVLRYSDRKSVIAILQKEDDPATTQFIIQVLGNLSAEEARILIFTEDYKSKNKAGLFYAIKWSDAQTLIEYIKKEGENMAEEVIYNISLRFVPIRITMDIADELLLLNISPYCTEKSIARASKKTLVKCLTDEREKYSANELTLIERNLVIGEATEEEAEMILNNNRMNEKIKKYAVEYASKETLLNYYITESDIGLVDECLARLKELMQDDK